MLSCTSRVGNAVRAWCQETQTSRREVFVTTKIIAPAKSKDKTLESMRESVSKVNLDGMLPLPSFRAFCTEAESG